MTPDRIARRLTITGVVQGVGFRPFMYALARTHGIDGEVSNTPDGVQAVVEGPRESVGRYIRGIQSHPPVLARVDRIVDTAVPFKGISGFHIVSSRSCSARTALISPDVCVCEDCLSEMNDPADRRFKYPFINCTNCGPRFTIVRDIPYDRPNTAMKAFTMCPACRAEYDDPSDRRFHAQPNACPVCGPRVWLIDREGNRVGDAPNQPIDLAGELLKNGAILAVKGLGGFHLAVDATNDRAVARLRSRKPRPHKPLALMAASVDAVTDHVSLSPDETALLTSVHRPIVLLEKRWSHEGDRRHQSRSPLPALSPLLAPDNRCLGVMLPYTPLHVLLLAAGPDILVMTSGNRSGEPLSIDNADALAAFSHIADYFLLHDRDIDFRADDTIARVWNGRPGFIRRSRGYVPLPLGLPFLSPPVLGCGATLKNTVCLTRGNQAFISQHIGDLDDVKTRRFFAHTIDHFHKILDVTPAAVAHDLHPDLASTAYAREYARKKGCIRVAVQHHHAHAVACMVENGLDEVVTAIVLDGTGFGPDGTIWGGEVMVVTRNGFQRQVHLSHLPMPGGDAAAQAPWRMAAACLYMAFGPEFVTLDLPFVQQMDPGKLAFVCRMMERQVNCPMTSSCGRLFDAVSSLLCLCHDNTHESRAAVALETAGARDPSADTAAAYGVTMTGGGGAGACHDPGNGQGSSDTGRVIDMTPCIQGIVSDIRQQVPADRISARFHHTLVAAFSRAAVDCARQNSLDKVVLSGGVFDNRFLLSHTARALEKKGLTVYTHTRVPAGDGGIALGQAAVAAARLSCDPEK